MVKITGTEDYASAERSVSVQTSHPGFTLSGVEGPALHSSQSVAGATDAPSRGIEGPISLRIPLRSGECTGVAFAGPFQAEHEGHAARVFPVFGACRKKGVFFRQCDLKVWYH